MSWPRSVVSTPSRPPFEVVGVEVDVVVDVDAKVVEGELVSCIVGVVVMLVKVDSVPAGVVVAVVMVAMMVVVVV